MDRDIVRPLGRPREIMRKRHGRNMSVAFWELEYKVGQEYHNHAIDLAANKIAPVEPLYDVFRDAKGALQVFPYYIGFLTVAELRAFSFKGSKGDEIEIKYQLRLFGAKAGTDKNPGVLRKLKRLQEKHGRLRGLVFDITRTGEKSARTGEEFELVTKIDPTDQAIRSFVESSNEHNQQVGPYTMWDQRALVPFKYREIFQPGTVETHKTLAAEILAKRAYAAGGTPSNVGEYTGDAAWNDQGAPVGAASSNPVDVEDNDIPF